MKLLRDLYELLRSHEKVQLEKKTPEGNRKAKENGRLAERLKKSIDEDNNHDQRITLRDSYEHLRMCERSHKAKGHKEKAKTNGNMAIRIRRYLSTTPDVEKK